MRHLITTPASRAASQHGVGRGRRASSSQERAAGALRRRSGGRPATHREGSSVRGRERGRAIVVEEGGDGGREVRGRRGGRSESHLRRGQGPWAAAATMEEPGSPPEAACTQARKQASRRTPRTWSHPRPTRATRNGAMRTHVPSAGGISKKAGVVAGVGWAGRRAAPRNFRRVADPRARVGKAATCPSRCRFLMALANAICCPLSNQPAVRGCRRRVCASRAVVGFACERSQGTCLLGRM